MPNQKYSINDVEAATPFFPGGKGGLRDQIQLKKLIHEAESLAFHLYWLYPWYSLYLQQQLQGVKAKTAPYSNSIINSVAAWYFDVGQF